MSNGNQLRPRVQAARARIAEGREKLKQRHEQGAPGVQTCNAWADLLDGVILDLYEAALDDLRERGHDDLASHIALVPNGGFGRRDVAPYSDVDLMILYAPHAKVQASALAEQLFYDIYDAQLKLGHGLRTPREACVDARGDVKTFTALAESRFLAGSVSLFSRFARKLAKQTQRRRNALLPAIKRARHAERAEYGETVYLLKPNLKHSRGGLRELHLLRWIGYVRWGTPEPDGLQRCGAISPEDKQAVVRTTEFLLRLRNEMHFHASRSNDVLDRAEQVRLAEKLGYEGTEAMWPVEQFMQEYFRRTGELATIVKRVDAAAQPRAGWAEALQPLFSHQVERDFRVGPTAISTTRRGTAKLRSDLAEVLRLADLANMYNKPIARATRIEIIKALPDLPREISPEVRRRFLSIMAQPARLGELLRLLHELEVLERIVPAFEHARGLLQFNEYHKYTVDEHCLRAVERATEFLSDRGPIGRVYRRIKQKRILHLALLIHDLGKGFPEDHSEVGARIATDVAKRLELSESGGETLRFLVHRHLMMSHLAFRRDTSSDNVVVDFAVECGSPEVLQMLFVLTAADLGAVGPDVWNSWKEEVLTDLFRRAMEQLAGDSSSVGSQERLEKLRQGVREQLAGEDPRWFHKQIAALPPAYLRAAPSEQIAAELRELRKLKPGEVVARGRYMEQSDTIEYTVGTYETVAPGVFYRLAGAFARRGLAVLSADIHTLADGLVLDRFRVNDFDYNGPPPPDRLRQVERSLVDALIDPDGETPSFRQVWPVDRRETSAAIPRLPNQVRVDNSSSDTHTIIEVFAADRPGLLYTIAQAIFKQELSVSLAKIGTYLDQVVDGIYVTDQNGKKIQDEERLQAIRRALLERLESPEPKHAEVSG